ncbi:MAG: phenylacetate--CoA ligase [Candidatus Altiarchaeales archaeon]|nr:MAG: phenylacetate--CoA ligase [Candidatus Altiarchaeales archaeon]
MYWNKEAETLKRDELEKLQEKRLKSIVNYVYKNSRFYREKFKELNLKISDINSIDGITKLPFTQKSDLRDNYPYGMLSTDMGDIIRVHASSGTTGKPTVVAYTRNDIDMWSEVMARSIVAPGGTKNDVLHVAYGYGLFTGGLGLHYGGERVGCTVIPASGGNTQRQLLLMHDLKSTILACTPSYAIYIAEYAKKEDIDPKEDLNLKIGIFGAEPWSESIRRRIEDALDLKAFDIYGLSEIVGPGVAQECEEQNGAHIWSDHFFPEIIDPETGEQLGEGEEGELVFTTLTKEGMPLLRYRTGDRTVLEYDKCACGRYHPRIMRIRGRTDDMLIIRGVNVFPSQIEHVLMKIPEVGSHYLLIVDKKGPLDILTVRVEVTDKIISDKVKDLMKLEEKIKNSISNALGLNVDVELVEPGEIPRSEGKAVRIRDLRKEKRG